MNYIKQLWQERDCKKQRNYCVFLLRKIKKSFYENLNPNLITDNRTFWKHVKPFFSDKTPYTNSITLLEKNEIVRGNRACAETFLVTLSIKEVILMIRF